MEVPRHWRLRKQRYALVGDTCPRCHARLFPPRAVCPYCAEAAREQSRSAQPASVLVYEKSVASVGR